MQKFYFTFGSGQEHEGKYVVIESTSADLARKKMVDLFGKKWAFQYDEVQWFKYGISMAEKYQLEELEVIS